MAGTRQEARPVQTTSPGTGRRPRLRPGPGWLALIPSVYVILLLVGPIVLIAMYSVNLKSSPFSYQAPKFSLANWKDFLPFFPPNPNPFWSLFQSSMGITLVVSITAVLGAYPVAYYLAFVAQRRRYVLLMVLLAPFFTSYLLRVIAWQVILNNNGVINSLLWWLHLRANGNGISWLIYSKFSVGLVLFYAWVPFVALPIFVVLDNLDPALLNAAEDLGASRFQTFLRVTLPLSLPGVIAGFVFVLIPTTGEFISPLLVGGPSSQLFGNSIQAFFSTTPDWNYGAVLAIALVVVVLVLLLIFGRFVSPDITEEAPAR
jgi:spermidine/putrescine transport system permease protein